MWRFSVLAAVLADFCRFTWLLIDCRVRHVHHLLCWWMLFISRGCVCKALPMVVYYLYNLSMLLPVSSVHVCVSGY